MTLDTLFNMAKGETQDAGETVNDVYKVGEISRKTGLQKQQDGSWAPPKTAQTQTKNQLVEKQLLKVCAWRQDRQMK